MPVAIVPVADLASRRSLASLGQITANSLRIFVKEGPSARVSEAWNAVEQEFANRRQRGEFISELGESGYFPEKGILYIYGYKVGTGAPPPENRRAILNYVMQARALIPLSCNDYMRIWGRPLSRQRFQKIKRSLEDWIRRDKNLPSHKKAVDDWTMDLKYFREDWSTLS